MKILILGDTSGQSVKNYMSISMQKQNQYSTVDTYVYNLCLFVKKLTVIHKDSLIRVAKNITPLTLDHIFNTPLPLSQSVRSTAVRLYRERFKNYTLSTDTTTTIFNYLIHKRRTYSLTIFKRLSL
jgi:hypothetical protein